VLAGVLHGQGLWSDRGGRKADYSRLSEIAETLIGGRLNPGISGKIRDEMLDLTRDAASVTEYCLHRSSRRASTAWLWVSRRDGV
jgi:hypothetical protein